MTPLAHRIVKELTLPLKDRTFKDGSGLLKRMDDVHCFEVTEIYGLACDLAEKCGTLLGIADESTAFAFLPAPKTWIEFKCADGRREGVLLEEVSGGRAAKCTWAVGGGNLFLSQAAKDVFVIGLGADIGAMKHLQQFGVARQLEGETEAQARGWTALIYTLLAIINTPRVIGRRQHMPHRGLQKDLLARGNVVGSFPLHAWTEIVLDCTPPQDLSEAVEFEAHLTGKKCLHFCRAHLRVKNGRVEFVSAHWRGDGSLGIRRSRYRLAA